MTIKIPFPTSSWCICRLLCIWLVCSTAQVHAQDDPFGPLPVQAAQAVVGQLRQADNVNSRYLEHIKKGEQAFLNRVCKLTEEQTKQLKELSEEPKVKALKTPVRGDRLGQMGGMGNVVRVQMGNEMVTLPQVVIQGYRNHLRRQFKELLTEDQKENYQEELAAREEFKRWANAELLLMIIEERVTVDPSKRTELLESLKKCEEADEMQLSYFLQTHSRQHMPAISEKYFADYLTEDQLQTLRSMPKTSVNRHIVVDFEQLNW